MNILNTIVETPPESCAALESIVQSLDEASVILWCPMSRKLSVLAPC